MAYRANILISSAAPGAQEVEQALLDKIYEHHLDNEVQVMQAATLGPQAQGVEVVIYPEGTHYVRLTPADAKLIVEEHLLKGRPVAQLMF
jgi:(2Fe-2S) ferredoxin